MLPLPEELPKWYTVEPLAEKGWTPKTEDIIEGPKLGLPEVINAWANDLKSKSSQKSSIRLELQIISPIQVGGGSVFEGGILPAQIGGVPCVPGSSIRGALLKWIKSKWGEIPDNEKLFWQSLISKNLENWQPRQIRFENILLGSLLKAFPLYSQQKWQVFNEKSNQLSIQWQVQPKELPSSPHKLCVQVLLRNTSITNEQKQWLETRLEEMLQHQGIGRGTASGFGRLARSIPLGTWQIRLTGMKPCIQQQKIENKILKQPGKYRWTPQVLRANLRGYFTRLALSLLGKENALKLTDKIFGALNSPALLILTSYLFHIERENIGSDLRDKYTNISAKDAHSTWVINVDCNNDFQELIGALLDLGSRLGGLGPGWRRPPHELTRFLGFRGSQFTVTPANSQESLDQLIKKLQGLILNLAKVHGISTLSHPHSIPGSIISIWRGEKKQWEKIVHDVCKTQENPSPPSWCGSENCPSYYAVREHEDYCYITVFHQDVEDTLSKKKYIFEQVWSLEKT
jgi:hypothetical protein